MIEGEPFNPKANTRTSQQNYIIKMGVDYKPIKKYKYEQYQRKYRPMKSSFVNLITKTNREFVQFTEKERADYKMKGFQLVNNLTSISSCYSFTYIKRDLPAKDLKCNILMHFH